MKKRGKKMKKLFHNESFKKYILISIICTAVLAAAGVFSYRRHTLAPERTVEKVLENITAGIPAQTSDLDELIKQFETQYQPYFTNEAYNQAVQLRQFTAFHNQTPDFEGSINISSPEFETLDSSLGDISLYGTFQVNFTPVDGTSFTQNWNIQVRLVQEDGRWLIRYMRLKFNKAGEDAAGTASGRGGGVVL
ncbi:hypothetical protein G5A97_23380 [[Clostridium] symbiosum]|jgi:hypothetical protein|nr:hypothetical protein [[Clostridium] symbiosum]NSI98196.1 hypothetical protein [[Clostridium] symbiosum]RHB54873.1 hypothetical protein DW877_21860 [[Clostridium] symbiosum]